VSQTTSQASFTTENASRYLQQRCTHFENKLPVEFDANAGSITVS